VGAVAYVSGAWIPAEEARLPVTDLGVAGGIAVSEMLRTFGHQPFRSTQHLQRLQESLALTGLSPRESLPDFEQIVCQLVEANTRELSQADDLGVILFVTGGLNPTYVGRSTAYAQGCTVVAHTFPLQYANWAELYETGVRLALSSVPALPKQVLDRRIKSRSRLPWHLADRAVKQVDPQAVAVLADEQQYITETAAANVCLVRDGCVISPPIGEALEGVSLGMVLELASELGYRVERRLIPVAELASASEIWLSSTPSCLLPVCWWQGTAVGAGHPGPVYRQILNLWSVRVGIDIAGQARRQSPAKQR